MDHIIILDYMEPYAKDGVSSEEIKKEIIKYGIKEGIQAKDNNIEIIYVLKSGTIAVGNVVTRPEDKLTFIVNGHGRPGARGIVLNGINGILRSHLQIADDILSFTLLYIAAMPSISPGIHLNICNAARPYDWPTCSDCYDPDFFNQIKHPNRWNGKSLLKDITEDLIQKGLRSFDICGGVTPVVGAEGAQMDGYDLDNYEKELHWSNYKEKCESLIDHIKSDANAMKEWHQIESFIPRGNLDDTSDLVYSLKQYTLDSDLRIDLKKFVNRNADRIVRAVLRAEICENSSSHPGANRDIEPLKRADLVTCSVIGSIPYYIYPRD